MMENNNLIQLKRIMYNNTLKIRVNNQNDIEHLKLMLKNNYSVKNRVLLDEKIRYDQELKSSQIDSLECLPVSSCLMGITIMLEEISKTSKSQCR